MQDDLADSLRLISEEGSEVVYGGRLGTAMAAAAHNGGGFLSEVDLRRNRAEWRETIGLDYRDHRVVTAAPPSTAWAALVRLGVMGRYDTCTSRPQYHRLRPRGDGGLQTSL